jgi:hypothetical protein
MDNYALQEYIDMQLILGKTNGNGAETVRLYAEMNSQLRLLNSLIAKTGRPVLFALLWLTMEHGGVHEQLMWKSMLRYTEENPYTVFIVYKLLKMCCA